MSVLQVLSSSPNNGFGCQLLPDFLSATECGALRMRLERRGFVSAEANYPPSYRNNQRLVFEDATLAAALFERLRPSLPPLLHDAEGDWVPAAINPRWRSCRYQQGEAFSPHQDGVYHAPDGCVSKLTFMIYLNQAPAFSGGDTVFLDSPPNAQQPAQETARVQPQNGALILFDHRLWHAGETVFEGSKMILRSDVLFRPRRPATVSGHRGYVFCLAAMGQTDVLSGGRDGTVRTHADDGSGQIVAQHQQSVLGLCALDHHRFASVSRDRMLKINDLRAPRASASAVAHAGAALCVTACADGSVLTGGADHSIAHWSASATLNARLCAHTGWVFDLAMLDATRFISVSEDGSALLWANTAVVARVDLAVPLRAVCQSAAGWVVGDANGALVLLGAESQRLSPIRRVPAHSAAIRRVRMLPGGDVLSASEDGTVRRWSADLTQSTLMIKREGFVTDAIRRVSDGALITAGYCGGVQTHRRIRP